MAIATPDSGISRRWEATAAKERQFWEWALRCAQELHRLEGVTKECHLQSFCSLLHLFVQGVLAGETDYAVRDTHSKNAPDHNKKRPDHCFVSKYQSSRAHDARVLYTHVAFVEELKKGTTLTEVPFLQQVAGRLVNLAEARDDAPAICYLSVGRRCQFYIGLSNNGAVRYQKSHELRFFDHTAQEATDGLVLYVGCWLAKAPQSWMQSSQSMITVPLNAINQEFSLIYEHRNKHKPKIFAPKAGSSLPLVAKVFSSLTARERECANFEKVRQIMVRETQANAGAYAGAVGGLLALVTQLWTPARVNFGDQYLLLITPRADNSLADAMCTAQLFVTVCKTLAWVLCALHAGGLVHGDLSPANILVLGNGQVVINDLGSITEVNTPRDMVPRTQLYCGRDFFCSPEYTVLHDWEACLYVLTAFARRHSCAVADGLPHRGLPFQHTLVTELGLAKDAALFAADVRHKHHLLHLLHADQAEYRSKVPLLPIAEHEPQSSAAASAGEHGHVAAAMAGGDSTDAVMTGDEEDDSAIRAQASLQTLATAMHVLSRLRTSVSLFGTLGTEAVAQQAREAANILESAEVVKGAFV